MEDRAQIEEGRGGLRLRFVECGEDQRATQTKDQDNPDEHRQEAQAGK